MPYVAVGDLRMYFEEHGRQEHLPLVLLHGFNGTGAMWHGQLAAFGGRYRLLVPDLRAHGRTGNPAGLATMNHRQFARDIAAFCRAVGVERAVFCGESTGAMLLAVVLEEQMMKVAEIQSEYNLATNLYRKHLAMLKTALGRPGGV